MYDVVETTREWGKRRSIVGYYYVDHDINPTSYKMDKLTIPRVNADIEDDKLLISVAKHIFDLQEKDIAEYYEDSHQEISFYTQEEIDEMEREKEEDEDFE